MSIFALTYFICSFSKIWWFLCVLYLFYHQYYHKCKYFL